MGGEARPLAVEPGPEFHECQLLCRHRVLPSALKLEAHCLRLCGQLTASVRLSCRGGESFAAAAGLPALGLRASRCQLGGARP